MSLQWFIRLGAAAGAVSLGIYVTTIAIFGIDPISAYSPVSIDFSWYGFVSLIAYVVYMNGFAALGLRTRTSAVVYSAQAIVLLNVLASSVFYSALLIEKFDIDTMNAVVGVIGVGISIAMVAMGWNMMKLKRHIGVLAVWYGLLEILCALQLAYVYPPLGAVLDVTLFVLGVSILDRMRSKEK